jgi:hypothetical protein
MSSSAGLSSILSEYLNRAAARQHGDAEAGGLGRDLLTLHELLDLGGGLVRDGQDEAFGQGLGRAGVAHLLLHQGVVAKS